jgi:hypothetical protein
MAKKKPEEISEANPVGGFAFYTSLFFLCFLALLNTKTILGLISPLDGSRSGIFLLLFVAGLLGTRAIFPDRLCVFIHELKHSIVSNLAGNRAKKLKFEDQTGSFTYEYTKRTAAYNAFIALAPYWFPLFTLIGLPIAVFAAPQHSLIVVGIGGLLFGSDWYLNMRDFSPHQTDITGIRGGYAIGALYILAMNVTLSSIVVAWILRDVAGLLALVQNLWEFLLQVVHAFR